MLMSVLVSMLTATLLMNTITATIFYLSSYKAMNKIYVPTIFLMDIPIQTKHVTYSK